jgi:site-specific recombinase XerD
MRFHDLRHGFASLAVATGADLGTVRDALGHSSIAVTQIYAHIAPRLKRDVADRLDAALTGS